MSKVEEMVKRLCPEGVEYKALGEISSCVAGATPDTKNPEYWDGGHIPWMSSGEVNKRIITDVSARITQSGYDSCSTKMLPINSVVIALAGQGKTRGTVAITKIELCTNQSLAGIVLDGDELKPEFLYHFLRSQYENLRSVSSGDGTRGGLNLKMLRAYRIPVPPIEIQDALVEVLDAFAELEAELEAKLEAELEARKAQYAYYRDKLLDFGDPPPSLNRTVKVVALGDIALQAFSGGTPNKSHSEYYEKGNIPWLRTQEVVYRDIYETEAFITEEGLAHSSARWIPKNCVIVAISGASAGRCAINKIPMTTNQHCLNIKVDDSVASYRYVYHCVCNQYDELIAMKEGARGDLNASRIKGLKISLPPLEEQQRIVEILDKFDALVNDISQGLPAEIEARRKQYEYYRDKLLTFKEKAA